MGNPATRWASALVDELAAAGVETACLAPGSRSTPLTLAFDAHDAVETHSHLDERSAAFFALGRGRRTGRPTAVVTTSGTATANLHPAVMEADEGRVPLLLLTADRPPELRDSGANQTVDQTDLYGGAVRFHRDLPTPAVDPAEAAYASASGLDEPGGDRALRSLRVAAARAVSASVRAPAGPVHLNVPARKPLEPEGRTVPDPSAAGGNGGDGPSVETVAGHPRLDPAARRRVRDAITAADRGLIVAGPMDTGTDPGPVAELAAATGFPLLADPLSGLRFGPRATDRGDRDASPLRCGGYDAYLDPAITADWPDPDAVVRVGASPTSKRLRAYLRDADARQLLVDPAGGWREATFTATDLLVAAPDRLAAALADAIPADGPGGGVDSGWRRRFERAERQYWDLVDDRGRPTEAAVVATAIEGAPDPSTVVVGNSTPIRDADRFVPPTPTSVTALGNRGASGIDGTISTALGAGSATDEPLVCVLGDLAYYHDTNGLLAIERCDVDATIVLIDNDGGGIFHRLPIAAYEPFEEAFRTPHGLDFEPTGDLYGFDYRRTPPSAFRDTYADSLAADGTTVVAVPTDAARNQREREALQEALRDAVA